MIAVVAERGADVGLDDIAAASGIAKPVYYRYFADKSDLFLAVGRTVAETVVAETTTAIDHAASPRAMVAAGIGAYVASIDANPELYRFVAHNPILRRLEAADVLTDYATVVGLHASRVIGEVLQAEGQDAAVAESWGFGIVGLVRSSVDRWLERGRPIGRPALVAHLTNLVWAGVGRAGAAPDSRNP
ncbi:MAG: TetR family transcriptional regulator [Candidatus Dormibacteria bacterium]